MRLEITTECRGLNENEHEKSLFSVEEPGFLVPVVSDPSVWYQSLRQIQG